MSIINTLITGRTQADVERANYLNSLWVQRVWTGTPEELAEWEAGAKGAYNASDLNRVQEAMEYLAGVFGAYGYTVGLQPMRTWAEGDIPTASDLDAYLANLAALRAVLDMPFTTPAVPADMALLTYIEANNIERILVDINQLLLNAAEAWFYSGEIYCGEVT